MLRRHPGLAAQTTRGGATLEVAERRKHAAYPECVLACETGGTSCYGS